MASWNPRANEIFASILELPPAQRQAALERACGAGGELLRQVEALLAAHAEAGSFFDRPAGGAADPGTRDIPSTAPDSGPPLPAGGSVVRALAAAPPTAAEAGAARSCRFQLLQPPTQEAQGPEGAQEQEAEAQHRQPEHQVRSQPPKIHCEHLTH
jgi:hypothetical protein